MELCSIKVIKQIEDCEAGQHLPHDEQTLIQVEDVFGLFNFEQIRLEIAPNLNEVDNGEALCGVGTTETPFRRGSRGLQIAAVVFFTREEKMRHA